jgi:GH15 family glucan-1,4-alpha-glucosidase
VQLDAYGEVVDAVSRYVGAGGSLDRDARAMLRGIGRYVCEHWRDSDSGIWEPRVAPRRWVHSALLCWVALDRLLAMDEEGRAEGVADERCVSERELLRETIRVQGWNPDVGSYVDVLGGDQIDASLLRIGLFDFEQAPAERMVATLRRVEECLATGPGLFYRYERSREQGEGAFALCSFWRADLLARGSGTLEEAKAAYEAALAHRNDVGLFAEEIDPITFDALGNFPQAFTHVGVINAALAISQRAEEERGEDRLGPRESTARRGTGVAR